MPRWDGEPLTQVVGAGIGANLYLKALAKEGDCIFWFFGVKQQKFDSLSRKMWHGQRVSARRKDESRSGHQNSRSTSMLQFGIGPASTTCGQNRLKMLPYFKCCSPNPKP